MQAVGFNRSIANSPSATARTCRHSWQSWRVSIAQSRTAPLQPAQSTKRTRRGKMFQSLNREQPLCNLTNNLQRTGAQLVSIAQSRTAPLQLVSAIIPQNKKTGFNRSIANSPSATRRALISRAPTSRFQSLNREQPLCNIQLQMNYTSVTLKFQSLNREQPLCNCRR